ncbi:hypothetical protein V6N12_044672 [Hibiscus sabdariffa]|uniref:Uncharacterized protein n=1 Tax=Hibiscus sabdariffa TaxID=183260 RepID=A0ABR2AXK0_9ROSI
MNDKIKTKLNCRVPQQHQFWSQRRALITNGDVCRECTKPNNQKCNRINHHHVPFAIPFSQAAKQKGFAPLLQLHSAVFLLHVYVTLASVVSFIQLPMPLSIASLLNLFEGRVACLNS